MTDEERLAAAGYKLVTRAEFDVARDVPPIIRTLAARVAQRWGGAFVIYEPAGGAAGFLLVSDDRSEILAEALEHCPAAPAQASLF